MGGGRWAVGGERRVVSDRWLADSWVITYLGMWPVSLPVPLGVKVCVSKELVWVRECRRAAQQDDLLPYNRWGGFIN